MQNRRAFLVSAASLTLSTPALIGLGATSTFAAPTPAEAAVNTPFKLSDFGDMSASLSLLNDSAPSAEFTLDGRVKTTAGKAVSDAMIYIWHTDRDGSYDSAQQKFHGIVLTDRKGRFDLTSIIANGYEKSGAPRRAHLHFAVMAPGKRAITSELFFDLADHRKIADAGFDPRLEMALKHQHQSHALAEFDIVI